MFLGTEDPCQHVVQLGVQDHVVLLLLMLGLQVAESWEYEVGPSRLLSRQQGSTVDPRGKILQTRVDGSWPQWGVSWQQRVVGHEIRVQKKPNSSSKTG